MVVTYNYNDFVTDIIASGASTPLYMSRTHSGTGQLMETEDAKNGITSYAYDGMGNPIILKDANNQSIKAKYNALGQKLYVDDPNMGMKTFTYSGFGEIESEEDAELDKTEYSYDILGRLLTREVEGTTEATFSYDVQCKGFAHEQVSNDLPSGTTYSRDYGYDGNCQLVDVYSDIDGTTYHTNFQYDTWYGRLKGKEYPTGLTVKYRYDGYEQKFLTHSENASTGYVYQETTAMNERLQISSMNKANGALLEETSYFEATGQMEYIKATSNGTQNHRIDYQYTDGFGNLTQQTVQNVSGGTPGQSIEDYDYDKLHRMITSDRNINGSVQSTISYQYDAVGNFTLKNDYVSSYVYGNAARSSGNAGPNAVRSITKSGGGSATYSYDLNGNMESGDGRTVTYNAFNKPLTILKNGITSEFFYGPDQMRFKQKKTGLPAGTETTIYIDKDYEKITQNGVVKERVYIGGTILTDTVGGTESGSKIGFIHRDRLGSVVTISDENGDVVDNKSYDPFGKPRKGSFENVSPSTLTKVADLGNFKLYTDRGFTNHEHLDDAELIHMNGWVFCLNHAFYVIVFNIVKQS
jgi:hypothetical protein